MKTCFKNLESFFLVEGTKFENATFLYKAARRKPMLRQIEWVVQNEPTSNSFIFFVSV